MSEIAVIITLEAAADLADAKAACESLGLTKIVQLPHLKMLKGLIDEGRLEALRAIGNIRSVEKERIIQLPPRGAPIQ
jgi:hypothetical protein